VEPGHSTPETVRHLGQAAVRCVDPAYRREARHLAGHRQSHLTSIYKKIGTKNRVQATRYYLDHIAQHRRRSDAPAAPNASLRPLMSE
jgi:hypothetical protein